jgi:hypothetical protein
MAEIAQAAATLPVLDPEVIYNNYTQAQMRQPGLKMLVIPVVLFLLLILLVIVASLLR